jgi:hypothetical protein
MSAGLGFRAAAAQRSTHIALAPVGLGQRRKWQPLGARKAKEKKGLMLLPIFLRESHGMKNRARYMESLRRLLAIETKRARKRKIQ